MIFCLNEKDGTHSQTTMIAPLKMKKQKSKIQEVFVLTTLLLLAPIAATAEETGLPPLPKSAKLMFQENWDSGKINPSRWYIPRKKWGQGNHGVSPENV